MGKSCAMDLRAAGSSPAGQLLNLFCNVFFSSYKNSMSTFKFSSHVPYQSFRAQTVVLLPPTLSPCLKRNNTAWQQEQKLYTHAPNFMIRKRDSLNFLVQKSLIKVGVWNYRNSSQEMVTKFNQN